MALASAGVVLGTGGALLLSRLLETLLFGIEPTDAVTFASVGAVLGPSRWPRAISRHDAPRGSIRSSRCGTSERHLPGSGRRIDVQQRAGSPSRSWRA